MKKQDVIDFPAYITPIALGRPHFNTTSRLSYMRDADKKFRNDLALIAQSAMRSNNFHILEGAIAADIKLYRNYPVTSRNFGDVDNHLKAIFDALNKICYHDDSQIIDVHCSKHRSTSEFIRLRFFTI